MTLLSDTMLTLYVKSGCDGKKYGACPFCQRVFMVLMLKASEAPVKFRVATVPSSRLPDEFKHHGLRNLPALIHGDEALDTVEEIIDYIDEEFPLPSLQYDNPTADANTRDFFSKFCFYIKSVSKDCAAVEQELARLDMFLSTITTRYLTGEYLSHLDCEILPKLHHLRVASSNLKDYHISSRFSNIWRYLHSAYNHPVFTKSCPPDQEIVLHWAGRPDTPSISSEDHSSLTRDKARFSFDVPAIAMPINIG